MIYTSNIQAPSLSFNCIFHAFITLTTITISEYGPNDRVTYNVKLVQAPEMIPLLIPILTIYQISRSRSDVRNCAHEKQKKKKKKRKGKNYGTRTIQRILPCPFCLIAAEKLDGAPSLCTAKRECIRGRQVVTLFLLFSTSLQITRRTFAQRFACPRGRPHLIRMNGLARLTHSSNPPRFTRFRAKPSVFVTRIKKLSNTFQHFSFLSFAFF